MICDIKYQNVYLYKAIKKPKRLASVF